MVLIAVVPITGSVGRHAPRGGAVAAIGRFPEIAAEYPQVGYDAAIGGCSWIDGNRVYVTLSSCVVKATRASGHTFRLRT